MGRARHSEKTTIEGRLRAVGEAHRRGIERFLGRALAFVEQGKLNARQSTVLEELLLRLGERNLNPANTGNLEDLFCYTLTDTGDPIRAFAQVLADSVKIVPMNASAKLMPALRSVETGKVYRRVGDLADFNQGDRMLITHTMVAYGDDELRESAAAFVRATRPKLDDNGVAREVARMIVQSQHGPSSTFVLARTRGLTIDLEEVYRDAGYADGEIEDAQRFYTVCAGFRPEWVKSFLDGFIPTSNEWSRWRESYLEARQKLPRELVYQLSSDTLTNFLEGTLESGKWTDASIVFGGVKNPADVPASLARIVNQYMAEHIALHDRPAQELMNAVASPLEPWGVGFSRGRAVALDGVVKKQEEIRAQFDIAWARKVNGN